MVQDRVVNAQYIALLGVRKNQIDFEIFTIRLAGIDAPEIDHPYGQNAKRALMNLCRGQVVTAVTDGSTSYERAVATCTLEDGRDLSAEMVRAGLALDWGKHSGGRYRHLEVEGIRKKLWRVEARHKGKMPPKDKVGPHV